MGAEQPSDWRYAAASLLSWWEAAGVDMLVSDTPRDWLSTPEPQRIDAVPVPSARREESPAQVEVPLPATIEAFLGWRTGADAPEAGWPAPMIAPVGPAHAPLMILCDMPEAADRAALMEDGPVARLFDAMLAALGLSRDAVHLGALCVARPAGGRVPPEQMAQLGRIARHHVALASPKRLLVFGQAAQVALFGADARRGDLTVFNHDPAQVPAIATLPPRLLLERPEWKAGVWRDLQTLFLGRN